MTLSDYDKQIQEIIDSQLEYYKQKHTEETRPKSRTKESIAFSERIRQSKNKSTKEWYDN